MTEYFGLNCIWKIVHKKTLQADKKKKKQRDHRPEDVKFYTYRLIKFKSDMAAI